MKKKNYRPLIIWLLLALGTLFYYFGELVDWAAWDALRLNFFYSVHDVHRMFFLIPITYAGYTGRVKGAFIVTLVSFLIFLPRALFVSPYPDAFLRMFIFVIFAGTLGGLTGIVRNQAERALRLEAEMTSQRNSTLKIIDNIADGIMVTGQDYKIRFLNSRLVNALGEGTGRTCYEYLHHLAEPCSECKIKTVVKDRQICRWQCQFHDGSVHDVIAAPHTDADGTACQISIFRDITPHQSA